MNDSFRLGEDGIYRCVAFEQEFVWQQHGFGTRSANPPADVTLRQIHSDLVWNAHGLKDREQQGDALISNEPGRSVGVRTADCVPILLLDARRRAVAAVHAGWRGTFSQIVTRAVEKMAADFGTLPGDVRAALGPAIRECCYEVGWDVARRFEALFPEDTGPPGKRHLNLVEANRRHLLAAGVPIEGIFDCGLCTSCPSRHFFSFRREPQDPGRMLASIRRLA
ncbi:MAG TPA: peptidoglycan editing factor PgeF [Bryobacteraceae bacterium]